MCVEREITLRIHVADDKFEEVGREGCRRRAQAAEARNEREIQDDVQKCRSTGRERNLQALALHEIHTAEEARQAVEDCSHGEDRNEHPRRIVGLGKKDFCKRADE